MTKSTMYSTYIHTENKRTTNAIMIVKEYQENRYIPKCTHLHVCLQSHAPAHKCTQTDKQIYLLPSASFCMQAWPF